MIQVIEVSGGGWDERREYSYFNTIEDAEEYVEREYGCIDPDGVYYNYIAD